MPVMKRLNVRLPAALLAEIEAEARARKISKAHVVRERLSKAFASQAKHPRRR
jgi:hypothetical protein